MPIAPKDASCSSDSVVVIVPCLNEEEHVEKTLAHFMALAAQRTTGADSVVVSMIAKGVTCSQMAAAAAQNSKLGNGGSAHRRKAQGRFVDHGHHALLDVNAFRLVGGYDESFSHNEDAELDFRLTAAGCRIYLCAGADITYYPRKRLLSLF